MVDNNKRINLDSLTSSDEKITFEEENDQYAGEDITVSP